MPLIRDGAVAPDTWTELDDDTPAPEAGDVIVTLARWRREAEALAARAGRTGVALANTADPAELGPDLAGLDLIALEFPAFTDGRAYSQARALRSRLGFRGELRATGQVLADQAQFMARCGFDSFEVDGRQRLEVWRRAAASMSLSYQRGYEGAEPGRGALRDGAARLLRVR